VTKTVYLGLGSNVGDREGHLHRAVEQLEAPDLHIVRASPVYETEPVDYIRQPWFLNQVVEAETGLFPMQLLARAGRVERALGRVRGIPKGPRIIDIDILFFGRAVVRTAKLEIPHPAIAERQFVLMPLADLTPDLRHPVTRKTVREMLEAAPPHKVWRWK
jgi:2-amino-4-hydroxy-6-hydroxymethyldihydropteridine diphosphokinase